MADIFKATRSWLRSPRLAFSIIACIAVSIGGASTVLTYVYSLLLKPLPFPKASRLVLVQPAGYVSTQALRPYFSYPEFSDLRSASKSFEHLDAATVSRLVLVTGNGAERLRGEVVTPGYFGLFGVSPQHGRAFTASEYAGQGERAILLSHRLWRTRFGGRDDLVGRAVSTRVGPAIVVGVMPEGFVGVAEDEGTDFWLAEKQNNAPAMLTDRAGPTTLVFGRLRAGVTPQVAEADTTAIMARIAQLGTSPSPRSAAALLPFAEKWRAELRPGLITMLVASFFLLAIGCGNVAILLLARLVTRERELAVRLSIGAGRRDLVRLMFAEGAILAVVGGGLGVVLASWLSELFQTMGGLALPTHLPISFGAVPIALCTAVVVITGLVFSLLPALLAGRIDSAGALRAGGRSVAAGALHGRGGRLLVMGQTALAVILLAGASLFLRSYDRLRFVDLGFRSDNLLRYQVSLPRETYPTSESIDAFFDHLALDLRAIPGVAQTAYFGPTLPPYDANEVELRVNGRDLSTPDGTLKVSQHFATTEAFEILRVPLKSGRFFGPEDRRGAPAVALVSETLARSIAPGRSALGETLLVGPDTAATVVGVLKDARWNGQRNRRPSGLNVFLSLKQFPQASVGVLFEPKVSARSLIDPVRAVVVRNDPTAALHWIDTMDEALDFQTVSERFWTVLAAAYASTAFILAVLGLYGILTHAVVTRTREIGVRLALGATAGNVTRFVTGQGLRLVGLGLTLGVFVVLALGRFLESRLYETRASDPLAITGAAALLLVASGITAWLPARRASRISPLTALRSE